MPMKLPRPDFKLFRLDELLKRPTTHPLKSPGQSPGLLLHLGEQRVERVVFTATEYDEEKAESIATEDVSECLRFADTREVTWIHVTGLHDPEPIAKLGEAFHVHPLILEDILSTHCRPKIEEFDDYIFIVTKLLHYDEARHTVDVQQFSLLLLPDTSVITFLEGPTPVFDPVFQRIQASVSGRIRRCGADYLAWALLDTVVDHYFSVMDGVDEAIAEFEDRFEEDPNSVRAPELYQLKKEVSALHRLVRPIRDIATILYRSESTLITPHTRPFFRDLYDHAVHVLEQTEDLRENAAALRDFSLSHASHRMNEIVKVLTSFSAIFLPLTFLVGVYGMNFDMPELHIAWAYPAVWVACVLIAFGMFWYFRKRDWM
jgi:magnesium transporter